MAQMFHISDPESETSDQERPQATKVPPSGSTLQIPDHKPPGKLPNRHRINSDHQTSTNSRDSQEGGHDEDDCFPMENAPFRIRSHSAPPALWAAKKYGRQLRRMSDEFDTLGMKRVRSAGTARQMRTSFSSWFASLWSHKETDGDSGASITASDTRTAE